MKMLIVKIFILALILSPSVGPTNEDIGKPKKLIATNEYYSTKSKPVAFCPTHKL